MGKVKFTTRSSTKSPLTEVKRNRPKAWARLKEKEEATKRIQEEARILREEKVMQKKLERTPEADSFVPASKLDLACEEQGYFLNDGKPVKIRFPR